MPREVISLQNSLKRFLGYFCMKSSVLIKLLILGRGGDFGGLKCRLDFFMGGDFSDSLRA